MRFFDKSLFREQALESQGKTERLDVLPQVTAPHEQVVLAGLALVLLGAVAWSVFGTVERRLTTECFLVRPGDRHAVLAALSGTVTDVLVDAGDAVQAGQVVARVGRPELRRSIRIARARMAALEAGSPGAPLQAVRAELAELEMIEEVGDVIVSSHTGVVTALALTPGEAVSAGEQVARVRTGAATGMEAVAFIAPERAPSVTAGMAARVLVPAADGRGGGGASVLEAELLEVSARPTIAPGWLAELGFATAGRGHLLRLSLRSAPERTLADGEACRLDIVTGRLAPIRFLARAGSG